MDLKNVRKAYLKNGKYSNKSVTAWGGMLQMKQVFDKSGISKKLSEIGLPQSKNNNHIDAISILETFWVSEWIDVFRFSHIAIVKVDESLKNIFVWKRLASGVTRSDSSANSPDREWPFVYSY